MVRKVSKNSWLLSEEQLVPADSEAVLSPVNLCNKFTVTVVYKTMQQFPKWLKRQFSL